MSATPLSHSFTSALLLVDDENNAVVDRRALRDVGILQIRIMTSGMQTARLLAGQVPEERDFRTDMVLCHSKLADMSGERLTSLLRMHPRLLGLPILGILGSTSEATRLQALASGFSGLLVRPYSTEHLNRTLHSLSVGRAAQHAQRARQHLDTQAFDAALVQYEHSLGTVGTPESAFKAGLQYLQSRDWDSAIQCFQRALQELSIKGEAELGLATAWRGKGDERKYERFLSEAANTFARGTLWHKARVAFARLLMLNPGAPNPFLTSAENLIRAGQFGDAADALVAGFDLIPEDTMAQRLAQACIFTDNPESSATRVEKALASSSLAHCAEELGGHIREALAEQMRLATLRREALARQKAEQEARQAVVPSFDLPEEMLLTLPDPGENLAPLPEQDSEAYTSARSRASATATARTATHNRTVPGRSDRPERPEHAGRTGRKRSKFAAGSPPESLDAENAAVPTLEPLRQLKEEDAGSRLFSSFPGLNEALSVVKVTWKLLKM